MYCSASLPAHDGQFWTTLVESMAARSQLTLVAFATGSRTCLLDGMQQVPVRAFVCSDALVPGRAEVTIKAALSILSPMELTGATFGRFKVVSRHRSVALSTFAFSSPSNLSDVASTRGT